MAPIFQYSSGVKAAISRSRSTISLTATLCTRPALSPLATFFQRTGEISHPTIPIQNAAGLLGVDAVYIYMCEILKP